MEAMHGTPTGRQPLPDRITGVVRVLMGTRGLRNLKELALFAGMNHKRLSERMSGSTKFSAQDLEQLADAFEVDPGVFYRDPSELLEAGFRTGSFSPSLVAVPLPVSPDQMQLPLDADEAPVLTLV